MKLINYVIQSDERIEELKTLADHYELTIEEFILDGYCPSSFSILANTPYEKPYSKHKKYKDDCHYRYEDNLKKCKECWSREVLTVK
jgi:hypothetical protein